MSVMTSGGSAAEAYLQSMDTLQVWSLLSANVPSPDNMQGSCMGSFAVAWKPREQAIQKAQATVVQHSGQGLTEDAPPNPPGSYQGREWFVERAGGTHSFTSMGQG